MLRPGKSTLIQAGAPLTAHTQCTWGSQVGWNLTEQRGMAWVLAALRIVRHQLTIGEGVL